MEMRIVSGDSESARALADALKAALGDHRVSLRRGRPAVEVRIKNASDRTVLGVLDTVERWLDHAGSRSAELWLGERSYTIGRWAPTGLWQ